MLIIALVLAAIGLAALVFAVVTSNALVAWVCIGASLLGVLLLIVDALRERRAQTRPGAAEAAQDTDDTGASAEDAEAAEAHADSTEAADAADGLGFGSDAVGFDASGTDETTADADEPAAHPAD